MSFMHFYINHVYLQDKQAHRHTHISIGRNVYVSGEGERERDGKSMQEFLCGVVVVLWMWNLLPLLSFLT